uniref:DUF148 domain-containing protein n=1 Tax=Rhabditophanes sp. KR3021 TaxID=114890 RepID=A0AC35U271_9BILA
MNLRGYHCSTIPFTDIPRRDGKMAEYKSYNSRRGGRGRGGFLGGNRRNFGNNRQYRFNAQRSANGEHFLGAFTENIVKEFLKIRNNDKLTKAELKKAEEEFIREQSEEVQQKYNTFIEELNQKRSEFEKNKASKYEALSAEAKKLYDDCENIKKEENISFRDERIKIKNLVNEAPTGVRSELKKVLENEVSVGAPRSTSEEKKTKPQKKGFPFLQGLEAPLVEEYISIRKTNKDMSKKEVNALEAAWAKKQGDVVNAAFVEHFETVEKKKIARLETAESAAEKFGTKLTEYVAKLKALKLNNDSTYHDELAEVKAMERQMCEDIRTVSYTLIPRQYY